MYPASARAPHRMLSDDPLWLLRHDEPPSEQWKKLHSRNGKINIAVDPCRKLVKMRETSVKVRKCPSMPGFTFPYAKVESALVQMHNIAPDDVSAFRARFGALQRGGMLGGSQPGKGQKLEYGPDQLHRAVLAFELVQAGIAPGIFLPLIEEHWDRLRDIFLKAEQANVRETSDVMLILAGVAALSSEWAVPNINHTTMDKISERISLASTAKACQRGRWW